MRVQYKNVSKNKRLNETKNKSEKKIHFQYRNSSRYTNNNKKAKIKKIIEQLGAKYKKYLIKRCFNKWEIIVLYKKVYDFNAKNENINNFLLLLDKIFQKNYKKIAINTI